MTRSKSSKLFLIISLLVFILLTLPAWGGNVQVLATVDRNEITLEDSLQLSITIQGTQNTSPPELPSLPDFRISSSGTSSSTQIINMKRNISITHNYRLTPMNTGHFKIGSSTNKFNWDTTSLSFTGPLSASGDLIPSTHNSYDLGSDSYRWANIYTADLQLSNESATPNEIDGTTGSWTIQEGEDDLYLLNRKNGKKYRFKLEEIE